MKAPFLLLLWQAAVERPANREWCGLLLMRRKAWLAMREKASHTESQVGATFIRLLTLFAVVLISN